MIKGHNPNFAAIKAKSPYKSGCQIFSMTSSFKFLLSENCNIALRSMHTRPEKMCLEVLTFEMTIKI